MDNLLYATLVCLRFILTLLPQTGYIHPDEHFQGPEVVYGDITQFKVLKTWEFTSSRPIRNIALPYVINAFPSLFVSALIHLGFRTNSYINIMLPRLLMCLLSFIQDYCVYRISKKIRLNYKVNLNAFASSYVVLVYFTRTFSNCLESLFFSLVTVLLFEFQLTYCKMTLKSFTFKSYVFGILLSLGIFNRPTFICFIFMPLLIWLYTVFKMSNKYVMYFFLASFLGLISTSLCFIILDTLYFSKVHFATLNFKTFVLTPLNFVFYNIDTNNLSIHELHSRLTHMFINIPLLFFTHGLLVLLCYLYNIFSLHYLDKILLLSFCTPLLLLSFIPHQEPRFIIPLIVPLSLMISRKYFDVCKSNFFISTWFLCNFICVIFYGFVHQSGVYTSISYLQNRRTDSALVFYKTYMPPRYLLSITNFENCSVYDFAGDEFEIFHTKFQRIIEEESYKNIFITTPYNICVFDILQESISSSTYHIRKQKDFLFPNFSTEHLLETDISCLIRDSFVFSNFLKAIFTVSVTELERN